MISPDQIADEELDLTNSHLHTLEEIELKPTLKVMKPARDLLSF